MAGKSDWPLLFVKRKREDVHGSVNLKGMSVILCALGQPGVTVTAADLPHNLDAEKVQKAMP